MGLKVTLYTDQYGNTVKASNEDYYVNDAKASNGIEAIDNYNANR